MQFSENVYPQHGNSKTLHFLCRWNNIACQRNCSARWWRNMLSKNCNVTKQTEIYLVARVKWQHGMSGVSREKKRKRTSQRAVNRWRQRQQKRMSTCLWQLSDENIKLIPKCSSLILALLCMASKQDDCHCNNSFERSIFSVPWWWHTGANNAKFSPSYRPKLNIIYFIALKHWRFATNSLRILLDEIAWKIRLFEHSAS